MRIVGNHDRKAIDEWTEVHGTPEQTREMLATLAKLPRGDAWVWSPIDDIFKRVHFRPKRTFDSSATPKVGGKPLQPKQMAQVDLKALGDAIAATVEKAKADDPKELRRRLAETEKRLAAAEKAAGAVRTEVKTVEVPVLTIAACDTLRDLDTSLQQVRGLLADVRERWSKQTTPQQRALRDPNPTTPTRRDPVTGAGELAWPPPAKRVEKRTERTAGSGSLGKAARMILTTLAQYPQGRTRVQAALLCGYSHRGGGYQNALSALRSSGCIESRGELLTITDVGRETLGPYTPLPTGRELQGFWLGQLGKAERSILSVLLEAYPTLLPREGVAERAGYEARGGGFNNALSRLRTLELIHGSSVLGASDIFFEES
jgi:hypothetical protein